MNMITGDLITLIPLVLIIIFLSFDSMIDKTKKKYFLYALIVTAVESTLEIISLLNTSNTYAAAVISATVNAVGFSAAPLVCYFMISMAICQTKYEKYKILLQIPIVINMIFCVLSIWFGFIFTVTPANEYMRGPFFPLQLVVNICYILVFDFLSLIKRGKDIRENIIGVGISSVLLLVGLLFQVINPEAVLIWGSVSVSLVFYYIAIQNTLLMRDHLTMLFNRTMYDRALGRLRNRENITIINIDMNYLKYVNDNFGHMFGDELLCELAKAVEKHFEKYGYTYRNGGDEFCILCKKIISEDIDSIFSDIEDELSPLKERFNITTLISYGFSQYDPAGSGDIYDAVKTADRNMYACKEKLRAARGSSPATEI